MDLQRWQERLDQVVRFLTVVLTVLLVQVSLAALLHSPCSFQPNTQQKWLLDLVLVGSLTAAALLPKLLQRAAVILAAVMVLQWTYEFLGGDEQRCTCFPADELQKIFKLPPGGHVLLSSRSLNVTLD